MDKYSLLEQMVHILEDVQDGIIDEKQAEQEILSTCATHAQDFMIYSPYQEKTVH